jgi:hypothetical protein
VLIVHYYSWYVYISTALHYFMTTGCICADTNYG